MAAGMSVYLYLLCFSAFVRTVSCDAKFAAIELPKPKPILTQGDQANISMFFDEYRVNIDALPSKYSVPGNVSWGDLKNPKKFTSSAAYDLYEAVFQEQEVVVKILRNQSIKKSRNGAPKEMEKEIKVLSRLQHPNIIKILGHGKLQRLCAYIIEYAGESNMCYVYRVCTI